MSNSSIPGVTEEDIVVLNSIIIAVSATAKSLSHLPSGDIIHEIADYFVANPNFTNASLIQFLGTDLRHLDILRGIAGGDESMVEGIMWADSIQPFLPHRYDSTVTYPAIFVVFTVLATFVLLLRLYSRWIIVNQIKSYDYCIVAGFIFTFAWGLSAWIQQTIIGTSREVWDYKFDHILIAQAFTFALATILYPLGILLIKTSLLLFYYNLSTWRVFRYLIWGIFVFMLLSTLGGMFANIFSCKPVIYWKDYLEAHCTVQQSHLLVASGALNIVTDIAVWLCPLPLVWKLKLSWRERLLAVVTFGLGFIACVASCFRLVAIKASLNFSSRDFSPSTISSWTVIELYLGIICASAPFLRALVLHIFRKRESKRELRTRMARLKQTGLSLFDRSHSKSSSTSSSSSSQNGSASTTEKAMHSKSTQTISTQTPFRPLTAKTASSTYSSNNSVLYSGTYITVHASRSLWTDIPVTPVVEHSDSNSSAGGQSPRTVIIETV